MLKMDWAVRLGEDKKQVLVAGETKKDTVLFSSLLDTDGLRDGPCGFNRSLWPFCQGAAYAVKNNTRYVGIITPKELLAMEYFRMRDGSMTRLGCRCKVIPMHATNPEFTVNFGL